MAGFLSRLVTKICHVLTTVDEPRRNADSAREGSLEVIVRVLWPQMVLKNVRDIHGLALAIILERLNSHGAFPEVHDKTRATGSGPIVKTT
ncbi:hypothetical protein Tco_0059610 [Tanacetum coccineum]